MRVATQVVSGVKTIAELCREHQLRDTVIARWRDQFLAHAAEVFQPGRVLQTTDSRIAELERVIGQQHMEIEILKKASKRLL